MSIIGIIYIIGAIIALIIGIYEMTITYFGPHRDNAQYGMIVIMTLLSWVAVFSYIYFRIEKRS